MNPTTPMPKPRSSQLAAFIAEMALLAVNDERGLRIMFGREREGVLLIRVGDGERASSRQISLEEIEGVRFLESYAKVAYRMLVEGLSQ